MEHSGPTKVTSADLLVEATQLLKSLRMPSVNVMQLTRLQKNADWVLLDSGASHGLRPASSWTEWEAAMPTRVQLAEGETNRLRVKTGTRVLLSEPGVATSWIVPLGGIAELGYKFEWHGNHCSLSHNKGDRVVVEVKDGCPMVPRDVGEKLLQQMEQRQLAFLNKLMMVKGLQHGKCQVAGKMTIDEAMLIKLYYLFPDLPEDVLMRIIPEYDEEKMQWCGSHLPWNRRKRRRLAKAKSVVLHLFSGPDASYWERALGSATTEVLCVDLLGNVKADLHDPMVFWYIMSLAVANKIKAVVAGPPCRTMSALRYQDDGGPGIVRSEQFPYGLPDLPPDQRELVLQDSALWFKTLLIYMVCEDARIQGQQTALILEQPQDPKEYRNPEEVKEKEFMSMRRTLEWQKFQEMFNVKMIALNQGTMGHMCRKPTTLASTLDDMCELDGMRGGPATKDHGMDRRGMSIRDRRAQSRTWAAWAPVPPTPECVSYRAFPRTSPTTIECDGPSPVEAALPQRPLSRQKGLFVDWNTQRPTPWALIFQDV